MYPYVIGPDLSKYMDNIKELERYLEKHYGKSQAFNVRIENDRWKFDLEVKLDKSEVKKIAREVAEQVAARSGKQSET